MASATLAAPPRPASAPSPARPGRPGRLLPPPATAKILVPIRYSAWLTGDIGAALQRTLQAALGTARITRLPRAFLVEAPEAPGPLLEAVHRATLQLERGVEATYPVLHREMGPLWTGTLQSVFD